MSVEPFLDVLEIDLSTARPNGEQFTVPDPVPGMVVLDRDAFCEIALSQSGFRFDTGVGSVIQRPDGRPLNRFWVFNSAGPSDGILKVGLFRELAVDIQPDRHSGGQLPRQRYNVRLEADGSSGPSTPAVRLNIPDGILALVKRIWIESDTDGDMQMLYGFTSTASWSDVSPGSPWSAPGNDAQIQPQETDDESTGVFPSNQQYQIEVPSTTQVRLGADGPFDLPVDQDLEIVGPSGAVIDICFEWEELLVP